MTRFTRIAFALALSVSALSQQATAAELPLAPTAGHETSHELKPVTKEPSFFYTHLVSKLFDFDEFLEKTPHLQLKFESCTYTDLSNHKTTTYEGIGPCLYLNFKRGIAAQDMPGSISAVVESLATGKRIPVTIHWKPAQASWWEVINSLGHAYLSKKSLRSSGKGSTLLGFLSIKFDKPELADFFGNYSPLVLDPELGGLQEIMILTAINPQDPKNKTDVQLVFFQEGRPSPSFNLFVTTNLNVMHTKERSIRFEAEVP